ncbi:MAG: DUF2283 domain-containing protein [Desulfotignum sp.]|nr:DUF2283 domain-containing protein [Desulfotignum sp.]
MKVKYFSDTDTAIIEFTDKAVHETKEISFQIFGFWSDNIQNHMMLKVNKRVHFCSTLKRKYMPVEIKLNELPAGSSEKSGRGGDMIPVSQKGFYSSEDGELLIKRLEGWPDYFLKLVPSQTPLKPSYIDSLLVIILKDKIAKIYIK